MEKEIEFKYSLRCPYFSDQAPLSYSDKLRFFHLKKNRQLKRSRQSLVTTKSINSLITFVNNENIIFNDPSSKLRLINQVSNVDSTQLDTTDFSRFSTLMKNKHDGESFHYYPNMNQAPEIELPNDLHLPGIVDDINFNVSEQDMIVPSLARMNIVNELPTFDDLVVAEASKKLIIEAENPSKLAEATAVAVKDIPAPPPPPIPSNFIPPPPPIPPVIATKSDQLEEKSKLKISPPEDARSSLMQAIRSAGGKSKLKARTIPAADEQISTEKKKVPVAPAGDLMSDLNAKLALRRRGIAGTKQAKKEKTSLMDRVSKLIPPPSSDTGTDHESSSDDEWD